MVAAQNPRRAAVLDLRQLVLDHVPPGVDVTGSQAQPGGEAGPGRRPVAVQVAAKQVGAADAGIAVRDRATQPLLGQDEGCLVPGTWSEADDLPQGQDADAEMHDPLAERLARFVGALGFPDQALLARQPGVRSARRSRSPVR